MDGLLATTYTFHLTGRSIGYFGPIWQLQAEAGGESDPEHHVAFCYEGGLTAVVGNADVPLIGGEMVRLDDPGERGLRPPVEGRRS